MPGRTRDPKSAEAEELTFLGVLENYLEQLWNGDLECISDSESGKDIEVRCSSVNQYVDHLSQYV